MILTPTTCLKHIDTMVICSTRHTVTELAEQYRVLIEAARQGGDDAGTLHSMAILVDIVGALKFPLVWLDVRDDAMAPAVVSEAA